MNRNNTPKPANEREAQTPSIPHNLEVLIKKASVNPKFRRLLLDKRAEAAHEIDLDLSRAEADMLEGIPRNQLEQIIQNTKVPPEQKDLFSSSFGKIMVAVAVTAAVGSLMVPNLGHTLTPEQREHILKQQERLKAEMERAMEPNDVNNAEPDSEGVEEKSSDLSDMNES